MSSSERQPSKAHPWGGWERLVLEISEKHEKNGSKWHERRRQYERVERRNGASKQCEYAGHLFPKPLETVEVCCTGAARVYSKYMIRKM